jgi:hypothetical protein
VTALATTPAPVSEPRELYVRHARKNGRLVMSMKALDYDDGSCVVDVQLAAREKDEVLEGRSYRFGDALQATSFVTEAVEALIYLGCEIRE